MAKVNPIQVDYLYPGGALRAGLSIPWWCVTGRTIYTLATRPKITPSPPLTHPTSRSTSTPHTPHPTPDSRFPIPDSPNPTPYTLLPTPQKFFSR
ncbi:hypothetical protein [Moorena sp. SIO4G3]|uniref:hypothetical protein n=1 Tax=Moorena sp. SIO4G3 TaxID=2607821 RepID=UPI00142979F2|nr:hypothetical protein [Moorena sp. SIO4G3]NEO75680.1 hypothetical protein [Moorena sp. SIO4G3]